MKILLALSLGTILAAPVSAATPIVGMHILETGEIEQVATHFNRDDQVWSYVTIPIRLDQLNHQQWQDFFDRCKQLQLIPLVRLATTFDTNGQWRQPTRADIVEFAAFFAQLDWPTSKRHILIFNEPNHAGEWGGNIDPSGYANILLFSIDWFETEPFEYIILPAGLDAAAPNGPTTMESFNYIDQMFAAQPQLAHKIKVWNSHAYPNPGFTASAYRSAKNGIDGWEYELDYLRTKQNLDVPVFITETGWDQRQMNQTLLTRYYTHALATVWKDERILGITPFILHGHNGVFDHFSFLNPDGSPTRQMKALLAAKKAVGIYN